MENATKALLIAAAILIAILIISLSLVVYRMASETIGNVNLSEAEITQFNAKFTPYEGEHVSGERLLQLFNVVITHNQQEKEAGTNNYVKILNKRGDDYITEDTNAIPSFPPGTYDANVVCRYKNGLINEIQFKPN